MNIIDKLREPYVGTGTTNKAADALEDAIALLLRWQAAWDWADEDMVSKASGVLLAVAEDTDKALRRYGIQEASNSVHLKAYATELVRLDAHGRNTAKLTRHGMLDNSPKLE